MLGLKTLQLQQHSEMYSLSYFVPYSIETVAVKLLIKQTNILKPNNNFEEKKEKELNNKLKKELYEIKVEDEESFKTNDRFQDQDQVSENSIQETKTSKNNGEQRDEKIQQECSNSTDFEGFEIK